MNKAAAFVLVLSAALLASPWRGHIDDLDAQLYQCLARGMAERHAWLDPGRTDPDDLRELLVPPPAELVTAYPVTSGVSDVRNNGPELVKPLPAPEEEMLF